MSPTADPHPPARNPPVALVTGASRGIGRSVADSLAEQGYRVYGCARTPADLGPGWPLSSVDVSDEIAVRRWITDVEREAGRIDAVVNAAGTVQSALAALTSRSVAEHLWRVNYLGTFFVCRESVKSMVKRRTGRIVNFSSMLADLHWEGNAAYASAKAAVVEYSKGLAREMAPLGITCNVVSPGFVETAMTHEVAAAMKDRLLERMSLARPLTPQEVARLVVFLLEPGSGAITGQVLQAGYFT